MVLEWSSLFDNVRLFGLIEAVYKIDHLRVPTIPKKSVKMRQVIFSFLSFMKILYVFAGLREEMSRKG